MEQKRKRGVTYIKGDYDMRKEKEFINFMKYMFRIVNMPCTEARRKNISKLDKVRCPGRGELEHLTLLLMKEFAGVNKSNMQVLNSINGLERALIEYGMHGRKTILSSVIEGLNLTDDSELRSIFDIISEVLVKEKLYKYIDNNNNNFLCRCLVKLYYNVLCALTYPKEAIVAINCFVEDWRFHDFTYEDFKYMADAGFLSTLFDIQCNRSSIIYEAAEYLYKTRLISHETFKAFNVLLGNTSKKVNKFLDTYLKEVCNGIA